MDLCLLGLDDDGCNGGDDEEAEEDPEDAVDLDRAEVAHQLRLAGPVAGEEQSPGAHEQVRANEAGGGEHDGLAEAVRKHGANDGHDDRDGPPAPGGGPAGGAGDEGEDEGAREEASDHTEEGDHDPNLALDEDAEECAEDGANDKNGDEAASADHPVEGETDRNAKAEDKEGNEDGSHVGEPLDAPQGEQGTHNEVHDTEEPLVVLEPADVCLNVNADNRAAIVVLHLDSERAAITANVQVSEIRLASKTLLAHNPSDHLIVVVATVRV